MNLPLVARLLSLVAFLIAITMASSVPFAFPWMSDAPAIETGALSGLAISIAISVGAGLSLRYVGRNGNGQLYRKEAMAVVGISWVLATVLGALPFWFSGTRTTDQHRRMTIAEGLFESQSGFSTTGATVLTELEDPAYVPRSILFWRSMTHFLGGLGILVLFVAMLGQGSAAMARMQHTALWFAAIYCGLNVVLTIILMLENLSLFDALCHAFGTLATGGFSTYNQSVGHFAKDPAYNGRLIEMTILWFMFLAGTNFTLFYLVLLRVWNPRDSWRKLARLLATPSDLWRAVKGLDVEWRTYTAIIILVTAAVMGFEMARQTPGFTSLGQAFRLGSFQVVAIMTTTGFATDDFDQWSHFSRGTLFLIMFVGGCTGSTGGGLKVIRHVLFHKILLLEVEQAYRPTVVRPLRLAGTPLEEQDLRRHILVYFGLALVIFVASWMVLLTIESDTTWKHTGEQRETALDHKLIDSASAVAATLNNIGPGVGTIGATRNYAHFSSASKLLFTFLMMLGRLEIFPILVLFSAGFWRSR